MNNDLILTIVRHQLNATYTIHHQIYYIYTQSVICSGNGGSSGAFTRGQLDGVGTGEVSSHRYKLHGATTTTTTTSNTTMTAIRRAVVQRLDEGVEQRLPRAHSEKKAFECTYKYKIDKTNHR